jgi:hypothetical protein
MKYGPIKLSDLGQRQHLPFSSLGNYFINAFYVIANILHTDAHFSLTEPHSPSLETKVIIGTDLSGSYNICDYPQ